jgi:uncharacterized membrane protein YkvA (DUF1232 family)
MIFSIYYLFNPNDLIPDTFGIIGLLDDFGVLFGFIIWIMERFMGDFRIRNDMDWQIIASR